MRVNLGSRGIVEMEDDGDVDLDREEVRLADGTRLTEAAAEGWADEILAKNALAKAGGTDTS